MPRLTAWPALLCVRHVTPARPGPAPLRSSRDAGRDAGGLQRSRRLRRRDDPARHGPPGGYVLEAGWARPEAGSWAAAGGAPAGAVTAESCGAGAGVVRGRDWCWPDDDGGAGRPGVIVAGPARDGWCLVTARDPARRSMPRRLMPFEECR